MTSCVISICDPITSLPSYELHNLFLENICLICNAQLYGAINLFCMMQDFRIHQIFSEESLCYLYFFFFLSNYSLNNLLSYYLNDYNGEAILKKKCCYSR